MDNDISFEIPVYINEKVLSVLQFPTRTSSSTNITEGDCRLKLKANELQIDFDVEKNEQYDQNSEISKITYKSEIVPPKMNYFALTIQDGVHLNPIETIYQLRPDLNTEESKVNEELQRRRGASFYANQRLAEKHVGLKYEQDELFNLKCESSEAVDPKIQNELHSSSHTITTSLKDILQRSFILPYKTLFDICPFNTHSEFLDTLFELSHEINGNFVMKSDYYPHNKDLRDFIILQLYDEVDIERKTLKFGQTSQEALEILQTLCVLKEGKWVCKYPSQYDFQIQYPEQHQLHTNSILELKQSNPHYTTTMFL